MFIGIVVLAIFLLITGLVYTFSLRVMPTADGVQNRMDRIAGKKPSLTPGAIKPGVALPDIKASTEKKVKSAKDRPDFLPLLTKMLSGRAIEEKLRMDMVQAGWKLRPGEFVALWLVITLCMAAVGLLTHGPLGMAAFGIVGFVLPRKALNQRKGARRNRFNAQLPDAMTLIASSMRSGYSFLRAMQLVVDEMAKPISEEFAWVLDEAALGMSVEGSLDRMVEHVGSRDLELVVVAVTIQMQVGGNLAEILDTISETIRERMRIYGEIASLTAEGKLSGFVLFVLPVCLALALKVKDPDYFKPLLESSTGMMIMGGALGAQLLGGFIIKKMVTLDV